MNGKIGRKYLYIGMVFFILLAFLLAAPDVSSPSTASAQIGDQQVWVKQVSSDDDPIPYWVKPAPDAAPVLIYPENGRSLPGVLDVTGKNFPEIGVIRSVENFVLRIASEPMGQGSISGLVSEQESGNLLDNVLVCAYPIDGGYGNCAPSDNGYYIIRGLGGGEYTAEVFQDGWSFEYYNNKRNWMGADVITVINYQTTTGINFALEPGGSISGTVTNTGGSPLENIYITIRGEDWAIGGCTDASGNYSFNTMPFDDPVTISAGEFDYCGLSYYVPEFWEEAQYYEQATSLVISDQNTEITGIDFTLEQEGRISGTVTNASNSLPLKNVRIVASQIGGAGFGYKYSASNGYYSIWGLAPGSYSVLVWEDDYAIEFYDNKQTLTDADLVTVGQGELSPNIDFALDPGGELVGTVTDIEGTPLENIMVVFYWGEIGFGVCTDVNGQYGFSSIPYDLPFTVKAGYDCTTGEVKDYLPEYWEEAVSVEDATELIISDTTTTIIGIDFTLQALSPTFTDVSVEDPMYPYIEALYNAGYTSGCSVDPLMYCPDAIMDRAMAAVFMLRGQFGAEYTPNPTPSGILKDDWSQGVWAEKWAEAMYTEGLSAGCSTNPLKYCPWVQLNRQEASVFGLRMMHGMDYIPPAASGSIFADMNDTGFWATKWAEQAYLDGLLPACGEQGGKPLFCPDDLVNRGWGAYLVVNSKGLLP